MVASRDTKPLRSARHMSFSIRCRRSLMALKKRGKYRYGDSQADIRAELLRYSKLNAYVADRFADPVCQCGGKLFRLALDEAVGAAVCTCVACGAQHPIGDSDEYLKDA